MDRTEDERPHKTGADDFGSKQRRADLADKENGRRPAHGTLDHLLSVIAQMRLVDNPFSMKSRYLVLNGVFQRHADPAMHPQSLQDQRNSGRGLTLSERPANGNEPRQIARGRDFADVAFIQALNRRQSGLNEAEHESRTIQVVDAADPITPLFVFDIEFAALTGFRQLVTALIERLPLGSLKRTYRMTKPNAAIALVLLQIKILEWRGRGGHEASF